MEGIPLNSVAARKAGLKSTARTAGLEERGLRFAAEAEGDLCYMGPCDNGLRTVCYKLNDDCNDCYETSYGC